MTVDQLNELVNEPRNPDSQKWKRAFDYYNQRNDRKMYMNCQTCYLHVYYWIKNNIK